MTILLGLVIWRRYFPLQATVYTLQIIKNSLQFQCNMFQAYLGNKVFQGTGHRQINAKRDAAGQVLKHFKQYLTNICN